MLRKLQLNTHSNLFEYRTKGAARSSPHLVIMTGTGRLDLSKQSIPGQHLLTLERDPQAQHSQRFLSSARSYADLNYLFGAQDITMIGPIPKPNRRKSSQGTEHVKHRRTRSGCYTCRSRRVKVLT